MLAAGGGEQAHFGGAEDGDLLGAAQAWALHQRGRVVGEAVDAHGALEDAAERDRVLEQRSVAGAAPLGVAVAPAFERVDGDVLEAEVAEAAIEDADHVVVVVEG